MERGLALAVWIVVSLDIVIAKLFSKSGVMDQREDWHQYVGAHTNLWLMFIPFGYAALCEVARGSGMPATLLTITRAIGFVLLVASLVLLACLHYG